MNHEVGRAGRADDDIGPLDEVEELLKTDRGAVKRLRQLDGSLVGPVADEDRAGTAPQQVIRREFAHFSGADEENIFSLEAAEDFLGQLHGGIGYGDGRSADGGLPAHFPRHSQGLRDDGVERSVQGADLARDGVGLFHLAEDLGFAEDHRVEARGHSEQVTHDVLLSVSVEVAFVGSEVAVVALREELTNDRLGLHVVRRIRNDLHPVAGRKNQAFEDALAAGQVSQGFHQARFLDVHTLAHFDGRRPVVYPYEAQVHS